MTTRLLLAAVLLVLSMIAAGAEAPAGDPRVQKLLKQADLAYETNEEGDFAVVFGFANDRSQVVFIGSQTDKIESLEVRELWSMAFSSKRPLSADLANRLLRENGELAVGAWQVVSDGSAYLVLFSAQIPANASGPNLTDYLNLVATVADELEGELTKKDEF